MTRDSLADLLRLTHPPVTISAERVERVAASVLARLDADADGTVPSMRRLSNRQPTRSLWAGDLLWRFAAPMAAAAALGIFTGEHIVATQIEFSLLDLLSSGVMFTSGLFPGAF